MAARNEQAPLTLIDDGGPVVVMVLDRHTYGALQAAVQVAFEDLDTTPPEFRDASTTLWTAMITGAGR